MAAEKFPYFWNTPKESWAELFVIVATGNNSSGPNTLPTVDRVYGMNHVDGGIKAQQIGRQKNFAYQKERAAGYGSPFLLVF